MKFILFVEGHTEQKAVPEFLKRWLDARLRQPVGIKPVRFDGWPELVKDTKKRAQMYLSGPTAPGDVIAVIALLDLYGPTFYPAGVTTAQQRYAWAKKHLEDAVGLSKFRQFFAVHETEAWLLSDPDVFPPAVKDGLPSKEPETVNFEVTPAKLLDKLYDQNLKRGYKKVTNGKELFKKLDPGTAYEKCPHLKALLDEMLQMAKDAGLG